MLENGPAPLGGRPAATTLPRISEFYGIAIYLYYRDHAPPHFHAIYAQQEAVISIADGRVSRGALPPRAEALVRKWAKRYRTELERDWELARADEPLLAIPPLE